MVVSRRDQLRAPTRDELRAVPTSAWVYAILGVFAFVVTVATSGNIGLSIVRGGIGLVFPAFIAAALAYFAPHNRLLWIGALCFAIPVAVSAVSAILLSDTVAGGIAANRDWGNLIQQVYGWSNAFATVSWIFTVVAVLAVAVYIGRLHTRTGWVIVAVGVVLWVAHVVLYFITVQPILDLVVASGESSLDMLLGPLTQLTVVAWAYLLAVTFERRAVLLALAAGTRLAIAAAAIVWQTLFAATQSEAQDGSQPVILLVFLAIGWALEITFWITMIRGILSELRREQPNSPEPEQLSNEALSLGR